MVIVTAVLLFMVIVALTVWASFGVDPDPWESPEQAPLIRREEKLEYRAGEAPHFVVDVRPEAEAGHPDGTLYRGEGRC